MTLDLAMVLNRTPKAQETNKQKKMIFIPLKLITFMHQKSSREKTTHRIGKEKKKFQSIYLIKI